MKKLLILLLCIGLLVFAGCTGEKKEPAPSPQAQDTNHLTGDDNGFLISTTREVRNMSEMIKPTKPDHEVISLMVKVENNTRADIPISPDFVTITTDDGATHKYAQNQIKASPLGKSAFTERTIPPDYQGGGLLLFEIKSGLTVTSLNYKDKSGHNITLNYRTEQPKNNI